MWADVVAKFGAVEVRTLRPERRVVGSCPLGFSCPPGLGRRRRVNHGCAFLLLFLFLPLVLPPLPLRLRNVIDTRTFILLVKVVCGEMVDEEIRRRLLKPGTRRQRRVQKQVLVARRGIRWPRQWNTRLVLGL